MSEIERAIEYYQENEFYMQKYNADLVTVKMNKLALTALKEQLEREKNPLTWNERINQMTVEEKAETFVVESSVTLDIGSGKKEYPIWITPLIDGVSFTSKESAINYNKDHLNSPYTEGETK